LLTAGTVVCYLVVEFERDKDKSNVGTAFFIDKQYLITAGHCLHRAKDTIKRILIVQPGLSHINYSKFTKGEYNLIECSLVATFYRGKDKRDGEETDFALLRAPQGFYSKKPPPFSIEPPPVGATVDVIGYPEEFRSVMLKGKELNDIDRSVDEVQKLLPKRTLTASRGVIQSTGPVITYTLSTVPGMSGSCVLYEGKFVGMSFFVP